MRCRPSLVDRHMRLAGAVQLKVLLWVLRHAGEEISSEKLAAAVGVSTADARDAMQYWVETGLLRESGGQLLPPGVESQKEPESGEESVQPEPEEDTAPQEQEAPHPTRLVSTLPAPQEKPEPQPEPVKKAPPRRIPKPDGVFVSQRINESQEIRSLMQEAELILGRPISAGTLFQLGDDSR